MFLLTCRHGRDIILAMASSVIEIRTETGTRVKSGERIDRRAEGALNEATSLIRRNRLDERLVIEDNTFYGTLLNAHIAEEILNFQSSGKTTIFEKAARKIGAMNLNETDIAEETKLAGKSVSSIARLVVDRIEDPRIKAEVQEADIQIVSAVKDLFFTYREQGRELTGVTNIPSRVLSHWAHNWSTRISPHFS